MAEMTNAFMDGLRSALAAIGALLPGFLLGWLSFELNEWRRRRSRFQAARVSLRAELEATEAILSMAVFRMYAGTAEANNAASELRWIYREGRGRLLAVDRPLLPDDFLQKSDDELTTILRGWRPAKSVIPPALTLPTLDATLASPEMNLKPNQLKTLTALRWHSHLLAKDAEAMREWVHLTFTVQGEENRALVIDNQTRATDSYRQRVKVALDAVRDALRQLGG